MRGYDKKTRENKFITTTQIYEPTDLIMVDLIERVRGANVFFLDPKDLPHSCARLEEDKGTIRLGVG